MKCLACHKETGLENPYHKKCLKSLFGSDVLPETDFGMGDLPSRVSETAGKMSISGVQIKASVKVCSPNELKIVAEGGTHILKPEPGEYPELPQNENLCMNMAASFKMRVPPHGLIRLKDGKLCYAVKRFDRDGDKKIHKEDMAQILNLPTGSKYSASLESVGKAIKENSANPYLDLFDFFQRILFNFVVGNGDMHLKNWSLLALESGMNGLAPCYDFVSSKIHLPKEDESALSLNGKRNNLKRKDFEEFAAHLVLEPKAALNALNSAVEAEAEMISMIRSSFLSAERQAALISVITERIRRLSGK